MDHGWGRPAGLCCCCTFSVRASYLNRLALDSVFLKAKPWILVTPKWYAFTTMTLCIVLRSLLVVSSFKIIFVIWNMIQQNFPQTATTLPWNSRDLYHHPTVICITFVSRTMHRCILVHHPRLFFPSASCFHICIFFSSSAWPFHHRRHFLKAAWFRFEPTRFHDTSKSLDLGQSYHYPSSSIESASSCYVCVIPGLIYIIIMYVI